MDTDRNLLIGVLALQANLIDSGQFIEACTIWAVRKELSLLEILVERGWLLEADTVHLEYLLERNLERNGDASRSLAAVDDEIKRSLTALNDPEIQRSLAGIPSGNNDHQAETISPCTTLFVKGPERARVATSKKMGACDLKSRTVGV